MKNLPEQKLIIILSVLLIPLLAIPIILSHNSSGTAKVTSTSQSDLSWNIVQAQNGEIDVYLEGPGASNVTAAELDVSFDTNHIKISSVEAGGFFVDPIKVKFDDKKLAYSLIINPENKVSNDLSKPLFKFHLSPTTLTGYNFSALPGSQVYLLNIGGAFPKESQIILK
jgi:hypothetical protein